MNELITATECIKQLKQVGVYKGTLPYFTRLVDQGHIPSHKKKDSTKRWYIYEEALSAINNMGDPSRDSQREANERKRNSVTAIEDETPKQITAILTKIKHIEKLKPETFDRSQLDPEDAGTFERDIAQLNYVNLVVRDLTFDLLGLLNELSGGNFRGSKAELSVVEFLEEWTYKPDTVRDIFDVS